MVTILVFLAAYLAPTSAFAQVVCVEQYGGGVECFEEEKVLGIKHEAVDADLGDNLALFAGGLLLTSGTLLYLSRRAKSRASAFIK